VPHRGCPASDSVVNRATEFYMNMAKPSKKKNQRYLESLSANLRYFYPKFSNILMCPVCFRKIDIRNKKEISDAHIIPKAAGGNRKTILCRRCNSHFGSKQDKWFGELIRIIKSEENIVQTRIKNNSFFLCDRKIEGRIEYSPEKGYEILIHGNRNPPEINDYVKNQFIKEKNKTFRFSLPILTKERMISVGYLTAAYLLWFDTFGYSWALQSHLDQIREQILFPDKKIINNLYVLKNKTVKDKTWIGIVQFSGHLALAAGFYGYMIIIPPIHCRDLYMKIDELITTSIDRTVKSTGFYPIYFKNRNFYDVPVSLMFENKIMFIPDAMAAGKIEIMTIYFSTSDPVAKFLSPIDDEQFQKLSRDPESVKKRVRLRGKTEAKYFDI